MSKQWIVETVKTEYPDLYLYNILEPNQDAGKSGVCYSGKYFSVAHGLDSAENARLIAAAPEMYEALKKLIMHYHLDDLHSVDFKRIEAILTKIEGV